MWMTLSTVPIETLARLAISFMVVMFLPHSSYVIVNVKFKKISLLLSRKKIINISQRRPEIALMEKKIENRRGYRKFINLIKIIGNVVYLVLLKDSPGKTRFDFNLLKLKKLGRLG